MPDSIKKTIDLDIENLLKMLDRSEKLLAKQREELRKLSKTYAALPKPVKQAGAALEKLGSDGAKSAGKLDKAAASCGKLADGVGKVKKSAENIKADPLKKFQEVLENALTDTSIATKIFNEKIDAFAEASKGSFDRFFDDFFKGINSAGDALRGLKGVFGEIKTHAVKTMKEAASEIANKQLYEPVKEALKELANKQFIDPMRDEFKKLGEELLNTLKDTAKNLLGSLGEGPLGGLLGGLWDAVKKLIGLSKGGLVRKPTLALLGEAGPEHIMNVNHPQSIDFFQRGVRPLIRDAIREEAGGRGGETHTYHIHIEGNLNDDRALEKLSRKLEDISRRRRRYGRA